MQNQEIKYRDKIEEYRLLNRQKSEIEERMDKIREYIATLLHEDKVNEMKVILTNGETWKAAYQTTSRSSTDLKALMELIGPKSYAEIVSNKPSTFLTIRKAGKEKNNATLINEKPIDEEKLSVPDGFVLS